MTNIFSPSKSLRVYSAMRMRHYAILLRSLSYDIEYRHSEHHSNADCLSRLPLPRENVSETVDALNVFFMETVGSLRVLASEL